MLCILLMLFVYNPHAAYSAFFAVFVALFITLVLIELFAYTTDIMMPELLPSLIEGGPELRDTSGVDLVVILSYTHDIEQSLHRIRTPSVPTVLTAGPRLRPQIIVGMPRPRLQRHI